MTPTEDEVMKLAKEAGIPFVDTPTPRTDAKEHETQGSADFNQHRHGYYGWKFARTLERELAAAKEDLTEARAEICAMNEARPTREHFNAVKDQLAAAQAREQRMRDALEYFPERIDERGFFHKYTIATLKRQHMRSTPPDTTALDAVRKEERERCCLACEVIGKIYRANHNPALEDVADECEMAIRALK